MGRALRKLHFTKKTWRKRHFAKICAYDEDGSNTAPIPLLLAKAYSELRRAPARPSGKTKEPQPGQLLAPWPTTGGGEATGARSDYTESPLHRSLISIFSSKIAKKNCFAIELMNIH